MQVEVSSKSHHYPLLFEPVICEFQIDIRHFWLLAFNSRPTGNSACLALKFRYQDMWARWATIIPCAATRKLLRKTLPYIYIGPTKVMPLYRTFVDFFPKLRPRPACFASSLMDVLAGACSYAALVLELPG